MDVPLVVSDALVATLVVEPVHEVASDLGEPGGGNDVGLPIVLVARVGEDAAVDVGWKTRGLDFDYSFLPNSSRRTDVLCPAVYLLRYSI